MLTKYISNSNIIYPCVFFSLSIYDHKTLVIFFCVATAFSFVPMSAHCNLGPNVHAVSLYTMIIAGNDRKSSKLFHPGLAEIPAPVGSQEVVDTPTNAHCWLVNTCLGAGRVLQLVQDGSHLINVMICLDISRVVWVTRACMVGGMHCQKRLHVWCLLEPLYCIKFKEVLTQKLQGPFLHIGLWKCGTRPAPSYCLEG